MPLFLVITSAAAISSRTVDAFLRLNPISVRSIRIHANSRATFAGSDVLGESC